MISSWRRRRAGHRTAKQRLWGESNAVELTIPSHFRCPISLDLMKDPVTLSTGITYDRSSIETWIEGGNFNCPITNQVLQSLDPIPNHNIRKMIQDWCVDNKSYGIERIPTPRVPLSSMELLKILSRITAASKREDSNECMNLVEKIKVLGKESEKNKKCIVGNGTGKVLSFAFQAFSKAESFERNVEVLGEILSALTIFFPLQEEAIQDNLESAVSLHCLVWFLKGGDLSGRRNSVLVLKEIISSFPEKVTELAAIEGALENLVKLIKEPICSSSKKASLFIIHHMIIASYLDPLERSVKALLEMGIVSLLLETLVDSERSICERALGAFNEICDSEEGREMAYAHALTIPVIVKKILRVSDMATELSVSIIWKLIKNERKEEEYDEGGVRVEALQVGAFQKLLLLLQVGCSEWTKEKATELLKLLNNLHRDRLECIDSLDFKDLKRPF